MLPNVTDGGISNILLLPFLLISRKFVILATYFLECAVFVYANACGENL